MATRIRKIGNSQTDPTDKLQISNQGGEVVVRINGTFDSAVITPNTVIEGVNVPILDRTASITSSVADGYSLDMGAGELLVFTVATAGASTDLTISIAGPVL